MNKQTEIFVRNPIKFMDGLMYFVKLFKQSDRRYFVIANNRMYTLHPYSIYPDPSDYFNAELDITIPIIAIDGEIPVLFGSNEKPSKELNSFIHEWFETGLMYNMNSVTRIIIDADTFYDLYKQLKDTKQINSIKCAKIESTDPEYVGYDKLTIYDHSDNVVYESTKYDVNLSSKVPRVINFYPNGQDGNSMYGNSCKFITSLGLDPDSEEQMYFGDKPVDAIFGDNLISYGMQGNSNELNKLRSKRCFLSKNVVPKEFAKASGSPLLINLYKLDGDNKTYVMRMTKIVSKRMLLSSDFKTIFV